MFNLNLKKIQFLRRKIKTFRLILCVTKSLKMRPFLHNRTKNEDNEEDIQLSSRVKKQKM